MKCHCFIYWPHTQWSSRRKEPSPCFLRTETTNQNKCCNDSSAPVTNLEPLTRYQDTPQAASCCSLAPHIKDWFEANVSITYSSEKMETTGMKIHAPSRVRRHHGALAYHHAEFIYFKSPFWFLWGMLVPQSAWLVFFDYDLVAVWSWWSNLSALWFFSSVN